MEETKKYIVYRHISPSGKSYIGITCRKNPNLRWRNGKGYLEYDSKKTQFNSHFINAINKYGWDNFTHEILCRGLTLEEANEKEKYYIEYYDSFKNGYNATTGGDGSPNHIVTEEARKKISQNRKKELLGIKAFQCQKSKKKN